MEKTLRPLYTTTFAQKYSAEGNELAVCNNFGQIALYKLNSLLSAENVDKVKAPFMRFEASSSSLYAMERTNDFVICAPLNELVGWKWKDLTTANAKKPDLKDAFRIKFSSRDNEQLETNSLLYHKVNKQLFAGCGNGDINYFDLEYGKHLGKYQAHADSIYQLTFKNNNSEIVSASEDGEIKFWDQRSKDCISVIKPFESSVCARPNLGKHLNCIAIDDDNWMICGGGPRLAMWHLRSMKPMSVFEFAGNDFFMPNACRIHDNQIFSGGNVNSLFVHTFEGKLKTEIKTSVNCVYDLAINHALKSNKILCVAGTGPSIDVCSNFSYRAFSLAI